MENLQLNERFAVVLVGAGHDRAQTATVLRGATLAGTSGIIGDEPELFYVCPPPVNFLRGSVSDGCYLR